MVAEWTTQTLPPFAVVQLFRPIPTDDAHGIIRWPIFPFVSHLMGFRALRDRDSLSVGSPSLAPPVIILPHLVRSRPIREPLGRFLAIGCDCSTV